MKYPLLIILFFKAIYLFAVEEVNSKQLSISFSDGTRAQTGYDGSSLINEYSNGTNYWYDKQGNLIKSFNGDIYQLVILSENFIVYSTDGFMTGSYDLFIIEPNNSTVFSNIKVAPERSSRFTNYFTFVDSNNNLKLYKLNSDDNSTHSSVSTIPSNAVVIPSDSSGPVQIILESSEDMVNWNSANPGTYGASTNERFFRVRAVEDTE